MQLFEYIGQAVVFILGGFLAFSGWLADVVHTTLGTEMPETHAPVAVVIEPEEVEPEETEMQELPTEYEEGGLIPRILLDDPNYQQAAVASSVPPVEPPEPELSLTEQVEEAIVNVFCTVETEEKVRATTGSGVFIDSRGVILTNAHVAQLLLLAGLEDSDRETRCVVRRGNPAVASFEAELLYISPAWIREHADLIASQNPRGTGERDYALLYVSESLSDEPLPETFPALRRDVSLLTRDTSGEEVLVAGYPATLLAEEGPDAELIPVVASTTVGDLFTFGSGYADLIGINSSIVGEEGSSGGPVVDANGNVMGLVVTRGSISEGDRSLRAITLSYINRTIEEETGFNLASTLTGDLPLRAKIFRDALTPFLSGILERAFE